MKATRSAFVLLAVVGLALGGCGSDDGDDTATATTAPASSPSDAPSTTTTAPAATEGTQGGAASADPGCERLEETPDGIYRFEAGEVTMTRHDDRLDLGGVRPAAGWTHTVDDEDDDEIEVELTDGDREVDFEAELDDGRLEVEICTDQDD